MIVGVFNQYSDINNTTSTRFHTHLPLLDMLRHVMYLQRMYIPRFSTRKFENLRTK